MRHLILLLSIIFITFTAQSQQMWINEIHYDNTGGDIDEFVEVVIQDTFFGNLSSIEVVFYNGSNGTVISQSEPRTIDTFDVGTPSGGFNIYSRILSSIQNGSPDGIALVNNGVVVEFISYEGIIVASGGPADGMTSVDIGVSEPGAIGESLQLSGTGNIPSYFTWQTPASHTRGLVNNSQSFADIPATIINTFPVDNTVAVEPTINLTIELSEPVNAVSTDFSIICDSVLQSYSYTAHANMKHFTLSPISSWPASSSCVVNLNAATITDTEGNNNPLDGNGDGVGGDDYSFSFVVASDALPKISSTTPSNEQDMVATTDSITLTFTENVDLTSSAITLNCQGVIAFNGLPQTSTTSVIITPINPFSEGDICTVTVIGNQITDLDGDNDFLDGNEDGVAGGNYTFIFSVIEPIMEIYEIQGSGDASPIADQFIRTQGNVVTAIASNGFFMQSPAPGDGDINTSDGLFVFSSEEVAEGDLVDVRGKAVEFYDLTELGFVSSVVVTSSGNALPNPIVFDENTPSQDPNNPSCTIELECYEGMLITIANGIANSGSQAFGFDVDAEAVVTATGNRAIREPGIEVSKIGDSQLPPFPTTSYNPDVFDENPEIFELDADALVGMPSIEINGGATFSGTGVLMYQFNDFEFWPKELSFTQKDIDVVRIPSATEITIATQNMFRFFDDINDPNIDDFDEDNTSTIEFNDRAAQASLYIRTVMMTPDIIILTEVENLNTVQVIANKLNMDDSSLGYQAFLDEGNDFGGIDIGILAKGTVANISTTQLGANEVLQFGNTGRKLHDRPPLLINAIITKLGSSQEVNVLGVHMRSRSGITGSDRKRIRNKHFEQSISVANMVQNLQSTTIPLVVIGDFNDFEFSDGYADVIGEIKGVVDPIKNMFDSTDDTVLGESVVNPTLVNVVDTLPSEEKYSFIFRGTIQALDHALINDAALILLSETAYIRGNTDAPDKYSGDYSQPLAMSDHDGLMIYLNISDKIFSNSFEN